MSTDCFLILTKEYVFVVYVSKLNFKFKKNIFQLKINIYYFYFIFYGFFKKKIFATFDREKRAMLNGLGKKSGKLNSLNGLYNNNYSIKCPFHAFN